MTHADDAESLLLGLPPLVGGEGRKCRSDPLQHACGVAPLCRYDLYAVRGAIVEVDMVEAYCGGCYEPYARALQKVSVAACARADDEHVGIDGIFMRDLGGGTVYDRGVWLQNSRYVGYGVVDYDFHVANRYFCVN